MANICYFKGIIKGKTEYCDAFLKIFPCYDILNTKRKNDNDGSTIAFNGECAWDICAYAENKEKVEKVSDEVIEGIIGYIIKYDMRDFINYRLVDLSILFDLEIMISSIDEEFIKPKYEHFDRGIAIKDNCPEYLKIPVIRYVEDDEVYNDADLSIDSIVL